MRPILRRLPPPLLLALWASSVRCDGEGDDLGEESEASLPPQGLSEDQLRHLHRLVDADGDGRASLPEVAAFVRRSRKAGADKEAANILGDFDAAGDGGLTLDEHLASVGMRTVSEGKGDWELELRRRDLEEAKFRAADEDGDGVLRVSELPGFLFPETHEGVFEVLVKDTMQTKDTDKDGALSPEEFWAGGSEEAGAASESREEDFAKLDLDHDGKINLEELKAWESGAFQDTKAFRKLFLAADKDGDMHLSADELAGHRELFEVHPQMVLQEMAMHHEL